MVRISIIIFIIFQISISQLQGQVLFENRNVLDLIDMKDFRNRIDPYPFEYDGSPYLEDEFVKGDIFINNKWHIEDVPLRYNIYDDKMEYYMPEKDLIFAIDPQFKINYVLLEGDTFVVKQYEQKGWRVLGFFKLVEEGTADLLVKMNIQYKEPQPAKPFFDPEPAEFIRRDDDYYVKLKERNIFEVKRIKKLIQYLGDHKQELTQFDKKEKISAGNEKELAKFIRYYNSLSSPPGSSSGPPPGRRSGTLP